MTARACWNNCRLNPDDNEIRGIDAMEDLLSPLSPELKRIRNLITSLEMCHHKAERWVSLIIEAIATGATSKGPGTRTKDSRHPVEDVWKTCTRLLSAWRNGLTIPDAGEEAGGVRAQDIVAVLGEPTDLRKWQVDRVIDKIESYLEPSTRYVEIVENVEHLAYTSELRRMTMSAVIRDQVDGEPAEISLAAAIDHLEGCHWDFVGNLMLVLHAIGGNLAPSRPYATCGRNIKLSPLRPRMKEASKALRTFWDDSYTGLDANVAIVLPLERITPEKRWLAASLDKTIRLQFGL